MASSQSVPPEKRAERNLECESPPGFPACPPGRVLASARVDLVSPRDGAGVDLASTRDATTFLSPPADVEGAPLLEGVPVNHVPVAVSLPPPMLTALRAASASVRVITTRCL